MFTWWYKMSTSWRKNEATWSRTSNNDHQNIRSRMIYSKEKLLLNSNTKKYIAIFLFTHTIQSLINLTNFPKSLVLAIISWVRRFLAFLKLVWPAVITLRVFSLSTDLHYHISVKTFLKGASLQNFDQKMFIYCSILSAENLLNLISYTYMNTYIHIYTYLMLQRFSLYKIERSFEAFRFDHLINRFNKNTLRKIGLNCI